MTVRNDGAAAFGVGGSARFGWATVAVLDERGRPPPPWPWGDFGSGGPATLPTISPGAAISATRYFQLPPAEQAAGHDYALRARARASPLAAQGGPTNEWRIFETAPLPLRLAPPPPERRLRLSLDADRTGWSLRVTDVHGRPPPGPLWGSLQTNAYRLGEILPLADNADGRWSQPWDDYVLAAKSEIRVRAWVAAAGYVTAVARHGVPDQVHRRVRMAPRASRAEIEQACGPWPPPDPATEPPPHALLGCMARLLTGADGSATRAERLTWGEAATLLAADPADGPAADRAVWLVELVGERPLSTAVILDAADGEPHLLLAPGPE